jgi:cytidine deaminase
MKPTTALAAGAGAGAAVLAIRQLERWCDRDECWLALADRIRRSLPPPPQSSFRVVAVVALGSRLRGEYVVGTNIEAGNLHNSVCAERVAFGALQLYCQRRPGAVRCIYIVTDAPQPISPGALCREFMYSSPFCTPATRVLSATPDLGQRLDVTLAELLPRASPYCRLGAADQRKWAKATSLQTPPTGSAAATAYAAAKRASHGDDRDDLHPTRYGVACAFDDGTVETAVQRKALEYGCSLDPVGQLAPELAKKRRDGVRPIVVALVDDLGVAHAPFASGRAFLAEHGYGAVDVLCHDSEGALHVVEALELMPFVPDFTDHFRETIPKSPTRSMDRKSFRPVSPNNGHAP